MNEQRHFFALSVVEEKLAIPHPDGPGKLRGGLTTNSFYFPILLMLL